MGVMDESTAIPRAGGPADLAASPFAQLDREPEDLRDAMIGVLDRSAASPEIARVREVADDALDPRPGHRLLDAGCGAGEVARHLARRVAPDGDVVALDASESAVSVAAGRHDGGRVAYQVGDLTALPFPDATFHGVRTERVLQHLADPDAAVAELARVTRPGGRVCLIDTDWQSLAVDGIPPELFVELAERTSMRGVQHHADMGRTLRRRLVRVGLVDIRTWPVPLCFTSVDAAARILPFFDPAMLLTAGIIAADLHERWFAEVAAAAKRDEFLAVLTMWVAAGVKPSR
jgi:SAM-dependent methyltransferase